MVMKSFTWNISSLVYGFRSYVEANVSIQWKYIEYYNILSSIRDKMTKT